MNIYKINQQVIEKEVASFESEIDFELVPVLAKQSSYTEHVFYLLFFALIILFSATLELALNYLMFDSWYDRTFYFIGAALLSFILSLILVRFDSVKRIFISNSEKSRQVLQKAKMIFFLKRLHELKSQHALLIYISVLEKKIVILPDPRIKLINTSDLSNRCLQILQKAFQRSEYEQGLVDVIRYLKTELKTVFPVKSAETDQNEYSNKLIWWQD